MLTEKIENLLGEVKVAEYKYYRAKEDYYQKKKDLFINSDWAKINEEREVDGLDKLSSEKKREYYIDSQLVSEHEEYKSCELNFLALKRELGFQIEKFIQLGDV